MINMSGKTSSSQFQLLNHKIKRNTGVGEAGTAETPLMNGLR